METLNVERHTEFSAVVDVIVYGLKFQVNCSLAIKIYIRV